MVIRFSESEVSYHPRAGKALYFAQNPNGGERCGPRFSGRLFRPDGRELRGNVVDYFSGKTRFVGWLTHARGQVVSLLALSLTMGLFFRRFSRQRVQRIGTVWLAALHRHRWFAFGATFCLLPFATLLIHGRAKVSYLAGLCAFYDYQALSLLQGRLDVFCPAIQGEAFVIDGRCYGYFGITPALLRIPFVLLDIAFGELSHAFMLAEYLACLILAYLILRQIFAMARVPDDPPAPWATVLLTANLGLGSTLFFLGSRAFLYHEALLCGMCFALASAYGTLRYLDAPAGRWWIAAWLCGTLSVHARPPAGIFALAFLGASALFLLIRTGFSRPAAEERARGRIKPISWSGSSAWLGY